MFAGWKVAGIVGLVALAGFGVQEIRVRGLKADVVEQAGIIAQRDRDVADAAAANASIAAANITLQLAQRNREEAHARLEARASALDTRLARLKREVLNAPRAAPQDGCPTVDPAVADFLRGLSVQPVPAGGPDEGGTPGLPAGPVDRREVPPLAR